MVEIILVIIVINIYYFGKEILNEINSLKINKSPVIVNHEFDYEILNFKIKSFYEQPFNVEFVDDWEIGREFALYTEMTDFSREKIEDDSDQSSQDFGLKIDLKFGERTTINVIPTSKWFLGAEIGRLGHRNGKAGEIYIWLPYQVSFELLRDIRMGIDKDISLKINKKIKNGGGAISYGVVGLNLD